MHFQHGYANHPMSIVSSNNFIYKKMEVSPRQDYVISLHNFGDYELLEVNSLLFVYPNTVENTVRKIIGYNL